MINPAVSSTSRSSAGRGPCAQLGEQRTRAAHLSHLFETSSRVSFRQSRGFREYLRVDVIKNRGEKDRPVNRPSSGGASSVLGRGAVSDAHIRSLSTINDARRDSGLDMLPSTNAAKHQPQPISSCLERGGNVFPSSKNLELRNERTPYAYGPPLFCFLIPVAGRLTTTSQPCVHRI